MTELRLPAEPGIRDIDRLRQLLLDELETTESVKIDGTPVSRIDMAALQLLAAFVRDRRSQGLAVEWIGVSATLDSAASVVDLTELLELPSAATATE